MSKKKDSSFYLYGAAIIVVVGLLIFAANDSSKSSAPSAYNEFAQCLTDSSVTMYGAWWCSHCESQKDLFGSSFGNVNYVECSNASRGMNKTCKDAGITGYPTWEFADGTRVGGEQSFSELASQSGCELPTEE